MVKKLFFTTRYDQQKEANNLNTYVSLVYSVDDEGNGKLQLVDSFGGETKTYDITLTEVASENNGQEPNP